jgi:hypothetical protein
MTKLSLMISHMLFMDDIFNIIVPHHVLNDYFLKQLVHYDFK